MTRRTFIRGGIGAVAAAIAPSPLMAQQRPRPSPAQLAWQRDELALFLHFGVNTFTDREWGDGTEDPAIFAPSPLDARQWARSARAPRASRADPHRQASRRLLPLADRDDDALGRGEPVARRAGRRRARIRRRLSRRRPAAGPLPVAVGSQQPALRRLAALQRSLLRSAHGAADALRADRRSLVRRRERRRPERKEADLRLAPRLGVSCAGCNRRPSCSPTPARTSAGAETRRASPAIRTGRRWIPTIVAYPGASGDGVIDGVAARRPGRDACGVPAEADTSIRPGWFYHPADDAARAHALISSSTST